LHNTTNINSSTTIKKRLWALFAQSLFAFAGWAFIAMPQTALAGFDYNANYQKALTEVLSLRLESGKALLEKEKAANPNNTLVVLGEDYVDFFKILINENKAEYEKLIPQLSARLDAIEKGDKTSPWYNYSRAEIYVHWAIHRLKFGDYFKAATEIREAYKLLEDNIKKHPDFLPNNKTMGMLETIVGTVPESYQWMVSIVGLGGSINGGMDKIETIINSTAKHDYLPLVKQEAVFIYVYLQMYVVKKPQDAWALVEKNTTDYKTNLLNCYLRANIALKCKKTDVVIETLKNRPHGPQYQKFYYLDYLMGVAKLYRGDADAPNYFKIYVSFHTGLNYIKSAYIRLSWYYFLKNDTEAYNRYRSMAIRYGSEGIEEDKRAMKEAQNTIKTDELLLKAMLYFDGGYLDKALATLNSVAESHYTNAEQKLEYNYRKARVYHEKGMLAEAMAMYQKVMEEGKDQTVYFAANSCLLLGNIHEEKGEFGNACNRYKQCSKFPNKEYRNSIQQKAKAGMKRVKCS
jgi:predicted negative regulator of RcsB-dependent stress response